VCHSLDLVLYDFSLPFIPTVFHTLVPAPLSLCSNSPCIAPLRIASGLISYCPLLTFPPVYKPVAHPFSSLSACHQVNDTLQVRAQTELQSRLCCFASRCHSRRLATRHHLVPVSSPLLSRHLPLCLGTLVLETTRLSLCDLILPFLSATSVMPSLSTSTVPSLRQTIVIYGMTMTKRAQNLGRWPDQISDTPTITATAITITSRLKKKSTISYG